MHSIPSAHILNPRPPTYYAGVQTMRARICSAFSRDMFARVVWLKPWGAAKSPAFALPFAARTCHAWLARLTRARGKRYIREGNALFDDFWYFWSCKSTRKEKLLYVSIGSSRRRPLQYKIKVQPTHMLRMCVNSPKPLRRKDSTVSGGKFYR